MIGIGIDTGGTCTDAVVYDRQADKILFSAKAQTTRHDLKIGICSALEKIPPALRAQAEYVAMSTTMATNACVENEGGRAGLILIGAHPKVVAQNGAAYGLPPKDKLCLLDGRPGSPLTVDENALRAELLEKFSDCGSMAIVQIDPMDDGGALERACAKLVEEILHVPCVLGSELFHERNILRRGASTLLNARLQLVMRRFLDAIELSLQKLNISVPVWIVRSDGTMMSRRFAAEHPVETLLCGPAASVIGGQHLAHQRDALIVDMGGTTTDISVVQGGFPMAAGDGIQIGPWRTMVHGVYIRTSGLGGDSRILMGEGSISLDSRRAIPLCLLAVEHSSVLPKLQKLAQLGASQFLPQHEFIVLLEMPADDGRYDGQEMALCRALEQEPLRLEELAEKVGRSVYALPLNRLENEGVLMRSGLTPTDILHLRGQFTAFEGQASRYAAQWMCFWLDMTIEQLCGEVERLAVKKLYCQLSRVLLETGCGLSPALKTPRVLDALAEQCYQAATDAERVSSLQLQTNAVLIGVGAPTRFFLPQAAALLGTTALLPEYGSTANALGAAVSNISASVRLVIRPTCEDLTTFYEEGFLLSGNGMRPQYFEQLDAAIRAARELSAQMAADKARSMGALGHLEIHTEEKRDYAMAYSATMLVSVTVESRATVIHENGLPGTMAQAF